MARVEIDVKGVEFGSTYRDSLTGFEGVASAVWVKASGGTQISLAYVDTVPKEVWVDADRLEPVDRQAPGLR